MTPHGSDRVRVDGERIVLSSRLPKGWTARVARTLTSAEFPGTAVLWLSLVQVWAHAGQLMVVFIAGLEENLFPHIRSGVRHEAVAVRHLHLRQALGIHHLIISDDAIEV